MIYEFQATQSFNGYDEPWAPGAGKNQITIAPYGGEFYNVDIGTDLADTTTVPVSESKDTDTIFKIAIPWICGVCATPLLPAGTYVFHMELVTDVLRGTCYVTDEDYIITAKAFNCNYSSPTTIAGTTITLTDPGRIAFVATRSSIGDIILRNLQVEAGSSYTGFAPYANVCMPEGFNIWDPTAEEFVQVYAGYVNSNTRELYLRPVYDEYTGEELVGPWMSSLDPYDEDTTPTEGAFVIDFGGELTSLEITPFMLQTLLDSLGIRQHFTNGAGLLNSLMDQAQGRVRSEEELLHLSRPLNVIAIGDQLPAGITFKPISKDVLPGLPGKFIR